MIDHAKLKTYLQRGLGAKNAPNLQGVNINELADLKIEDNFDLMQEQLDPS